MRQRRPAPARAGQFDVDDGCGGQRRTALETERQFDVAVARLAARRGGVVPRYELVALGLSPRAVDRRVKAGRLHVLHRGVYAVGHRALTWHAHGHAALLAVGEESGLSHASAAIAYRMARNEGQAFEVTVRGRTRRSRPGLKVHTSSVLEIRIVDGLRVTTPARTLLDLAAREDITRPLAEAQVLGIVTVAALRAELPPASHPSRRGEPRSRARHHRADAERARAAARRADPPRWASGPRVNAKLGAYEADMLWERERVVVETDGWAAHGHRAAFERDRAKDAYLQARGYAVLRFTWRHVLDEPLLVVTRIAQVLAGR